MASLYYAPCIVFGATQFYLPPWVDVSTTRTQKVETHTPPQTNQTFITSVRPSLGTKIQLSVSGVVKGEESQESILRWFEEMWFYLSGEDKVFDLYIFSDRAWSGCALESQSDKIGREPLITLNDSQLDIFCPFSKPDLTKQLIFSNYNTEYPYANLVGRPLGNAAIPGTVIPVMQPSFQTLPGVFPGQASAVTVAGQEHKFTVGGGAGTQWLLESIQVTWADPIDATGETDITVSTEGVGGLGEALTATVAAGEYFGAEEAGGITVTAGDSIFVFATAAGGHQNAQYVVRLKAQ